MKAIIKPYSFPTRSTTPLQRVKNNTNTNTNNSKRRIVIMTVMLIVMAVVMAAQIVVSNTKFITPSESLPSDVPQVRVGRAHDNAVLAASSADYYHADSAKVLTVEEKELLPSIRVSKRLNKKEDAQASPNKKPPYDDSLLLIQVPNGTTKCFEWHENEKADHWWTHHPLWSVSTENDTHSCFHYGSSDPYYLKVYANQFLSNCSTMTTRYMWNSGWAADLGAGVATPLQHAVEMGSTLSMVTHNGFWHYAALKSTIRDTNGTIVTINTEGSDNAVCPARDMSCYFLALTDCPPTQSQVTEEYFPIVQAYNDKKHSMYTFVTRQQQWLRRQVYMLRKEMERQIRTPCSVMHVRRADVIMHYQQSRKYYPVSAYMDRLSQYRKTNIVILTDDANAIDEALEFYPAVNWFYFNRTRFRGSSGGWENQTPSKSPKQEVITLLATLQLARLCDSVVYGESGFADLIVRSMEVDRPRGFRFKKARVDGGVKTLVSQKNQHSDQTLQSLLDERRKQNESTTTRY